jgi:hypothetical protein
VATGCHFAGKHQHIRQAFNARWFGFLVLKNAIRKIHQLRRKLVALGKLPNPGFLVDGDAAPPAKNRKSEVGIRRSSPIGSSALLRWRARTVQIPPGRRRTVPYLRTGKPPKRSPDSWSGKQMRTTASPASSITPIIS